MKKIDVRDIMLCLIIIVSALLFLYIGLCNWEASLAARF